MLNSRTQEELEKYQAILQLSKEQIDAIESNDFATFERILDTKGEVISSLRDGRRIVAGNPDLHVIVQQIQASEKHAEKLLYRRLQSIQDKMSDLRSYTAARNAYRRSMRKLPAFVPTADTPTMLDKRY